MRIVSLKNALFNTTTLRLYKNMANKKRKNFKTLHDVLNWKLVDNMNKGVCKNVKNCSLISVERYHMYHKYSCSRLTYKLLVKLN